MLVEGSGVFHRVCVMATEVVLVGQFLHNAAFLLDQGIFGRYLLTSLKY